MSGPFDGDVDATDEAVQPIDPRVAARLADVAAERRTAESRERRRRAQLLLVGLAVVAAVVGVLLSPLLGVHHIRVRGGVHTLPADVIAASHLGPSDPLVRISTRSVEKRIEALPWVERANVVRQWPRGVRITVTERRPAAVAPCAEGACLVDKTGRVLARAAAGGTAPAGPPAAGDALDPGDLPVITDVVAAGALGTTMPAAARPALAVALALPEALRPMVAAVRGNGTLVELVLRLPGRERNPAIVRLGDTRRLGEKLTAAATVLTKLGPSGVVGLNVLDVRVPDAPALTRDLNRP
jgi:cell division protein FtsQ